MQTPNSARNFLLDDDRPTDSHPHNQHIRSQARHGDFRDVLPDFTADAIVTDPPYGVTDLAYDKEELDVDGMWTIFERITKPNAVIVVFTCQPFTTAVIRARPKAFRYELIWHKNTVTGFLNAKRRPLRNHENILVFCRQLKGAVYRPQMEVGKPYKTGDVGSASLYRNHKRIANVNTGTRYPRSVRFAQSVSKGRLHPSEKPLELMHWLVLTYTNPGDLVCDPFMGAAPVGHACLISGRRFLGVEKNVDYFQRACKRLASIEARTGD